MRREPKEARMKILCFSDLHRDAAAAGRLAERARDAALVLGAGDFATKRQGLGDTLAALAAVRTPAVLVPGNGESDTELAAGCRAHGWAASVLHGAAADVAGLRVFGLGGGVPPIDQPWSFDLTERQAEALLARCERCDVLLTHSPPAGACDELDDGRRIGSLAIREAVERLRPRLVVCGHVHACWGRAAAIGPTTVLNAGPAGVICELL
jgi:Icc-related predicted phosphoesterase